MTVSVIIPTYNRAATVVEAIASVLAQSAKPHEIIVVDDGSTDATPEALARLSRDIVVIPQRNAGVSAARNAGLRRATGAWIAFLDSDDVWSPDWLATVAAGRRSEPDAGVVIGDLVFEGRGYEQSLFAIRRLSLPQGPAIRIQRPLVHVLGGLSLIATAARRDWLIEAGGFDERLRMYEDLDLLLRLSVLGPWLFTPFVAARAKRREEAPGQALTAIAARNQVAVRADLADIFRAFAQGSRLEPAEKRRVAGALSGAQFKLAQVMTGTGRRIDALQPLLASAFSHPSPLKGWSKAALLAVLGGPLYDRVIANSSGFHRENFEA